MAATNRAGGLDPQRALLELGRALEYALEHPTLDTRGVLVFAAPRIDDRDPISRYGGGCPRPTRGFWTLPDLAGLAALVQNYARSLGGGRAGRRPAPGRR